MLVATTRAIRSRSAAALTVGLLLSLAPACGDDDNGGDPENDGPNVETLCQTYCTTWVECADAFLRAQNCFLRNGNAYYVDRCKGDCATSYGALSTTAQTTVATCIDCRKRVLTLSVCQGPDPSETLQAQCSPDCIGVVYESFSAGISDLPDQDLVCSEP
jgi:hypothetical protein